MGQVEVRYYAVIPESEDPWGRIPLALYRATWIERDDWWWEELNAGRGNWARHAGRPDPAPHALREIDRAGAHAVVDDWKSLRIAAPWVDLEGRTGPAGPGPAHPRREPKARSETWQWRMFWVAIAITVAVVVLKNVG